MKRSLLRKLQGGFICTEALELGWWWQESWATPPQLIGVMALKIEAAQYAKSALYLGQVLMPKTL